MKVSKNDSGINADAIEQYEHFSRKVFARTVLKGLGSKYCLCTRCSRLNLADRTKNCQTAEKLFTLALDHAVVVAVWECPDFIRGGRKD